MSNRRISRAAIWCASAAACGALVVGGSGVTPASAASAAKTPSTVKIQNYLYLPKTLKIKVNTKVTWTNMDSTGHTVVFASFGTKKALGLGKTYSHKFTTAGTFAYHCSLHPEMTGKVVVSG